MPRFRCKDHWDSNCEEPCELFVPHVCNDIGEKGTLLTPTHCPYEDKTYDEIEWEKISD